jgi:two-component system, chemotaxis family, CheB/CheR fusion protein
VQNLPSFLPSLPNSGLSKVKHSTDKARAKSKDRKDAASKSSEDQVAKSGASALSRPNGPPQGVPTPTLPIVGVGASAGGLEAFTRLLQHLPPDSGMGFVLVQHLDPEHESALTQLLKRATAMPVQEVTNNLRIEANHVYVIPPNTNLGITIGVLKLKPRSRNRGAHHSIDAFFEELAQDQRERAIGVILSGTATDGTLGLEAIKAEGGITFAQDDSAKYDSMPRSAVAAGCVDFILNPEDIARELARLAKHPHVATRSSLPAPAFHSEAERKEDQREDPNAPLASGGHGRPCTGARQAQAEAHGQREPPPSPRQDEFKKIMLLLRSHCGVDFSLYKSTTIQRRMTRRMALNKHNTVEDYAQFLRGNTGELAALYSDCLISVTSFFRNPEAFEILQGKVFPKLLQRHGGEPLRVWVLGCSTGQEAYSIAMLFQESIEKLPRARSLQIFATDLNEALLAKARHGLYAKNLAEDISPERLRRFFTEEEGGYRIVKSLRDMVVFARQNLITDPPFSQSDLISCRNLLIYLEPSLQQKALPMFHYALRPEGFLLLGASESIGTFTDLFQPVDKKHKIYARKAGATPAFRMPVNNEAGRTKHDVPSTAAQRAVLGEIPRPSGPPEGVQGELNAQREADRLMVNQFAPPGVLINADLQILQFRGSTGAWLEPSTGKASFNVLKMAREGLMLPLQAAITQAKKENKTVRRDNVRIRQNDKARTVSIQVIPLKNLRERCFLILFEDTPVGRGASAAPSQPLRVWPPSAEETHRNAELERELAETRDYLQSIQEQHEASNEELQASNEEVQSANEELQSINEELETAKEELESSNEELTTVNEEMTHRNTELSKLNSDLVNLQTSTTLGIILLGREMTIRRFSAAAEKQFNLTTADLGRPIGGIRHNFIFPKPATPTANSPGDLESLLREVVSSVRESKLEVRDKEGRWYSLRAHPYFTLDHKVDGAVLMVVDITELKSDESEIKAARDYAESIFRTTRDPLVVLRPDLKVDKANEAFYQTFNLTPPETENVLIYELDHCQWAIPRLRELLEEIIPRKSIFNDFEVTHDFQRIGRRSLLLNARKLDSFSGAPEKILLGIEDISVRRSVEKALHESEGRYRTLFDLGPVAIYSIDRSGVIQDFNRRAAELWGRKPAVGDSDQRFCGSFKMFRPDGSYMPHDQCPMATVVSGKTQEVHDTEVVIERLDGSRVTVLVNILPLKNDRGEVAGAINCFYDITERKRDEMALRTAQAQLADHAGKLQQQVDERTSKLQDTIGELEHFSYTITHDMRAPLRAMQGFGGILLNEPGDHLSAASTKYLRRIMNAAQRMDDLIRDSLQYAKIIREHIPLTSVEPSPLLRGILESYPSLQLPRTNIQIVESLPPVIANPAGLGQCFSNLLNNAIKFIKPGKVPLVRIWAETRGNLVRFWFEDNGIGIPPEYQDRIFGMFQQLDKSYEGTGIGLALVRKTAERMGGKVGVESVPGKGSRFWLEFKKAGDGTVN